VPVIASGGVGTREHLAAGVLEGHADAVLAASVFHFGDFTVRDAKEHLRSGASRSAVTQWYEELRWTSRAWSRGGPGRGEPAAC